MRSLVQSIVAATLILAVLACAFFWLIGRETVVEREEVLFSAYAPTDIERLTVENARGSFEVYREGDGYVVDDIPSEYIDLEDFVAFMTRMGAISALKRVSEGPEDDALYGLDAPLSAGWIRYLDGTVLTLELGAQDMVSNHYYLRVNGERPVYLLSKEVAEGLLAYKTDYMDRTVTPKLTVTSPLSAIRDVIFSGDRLKKPIAIRSVKGGGEEVRLAAISFGAVTHLVEGKGLYELDQTYGIEILGSILDMVAREVVDYNVTDRQFTEYGFDNSSMNVWFVMNDGEEYLLRLVDTNSGMLAHISSKNVIYHIDRPAFADVQYDRLILRWFLSPLLLEMSGMTVEFSDKRCEIRYRRISNSEQYATVNGRDVGIDHFQAFYRLITSAAADGSYFPDAEPLGEAVLTITYHYSNAAKADDVLRLYPGSARRFLVEVNGICEFDIRESFYTRVREGILNLEAGQPIEENW